MSVLLRALRYYHSDAPRAGVVLLLLVVGIGANLLKPWPVAIVVDSVLGEQPVPAWTGLSSDEGGRWALLPWMLAAVLALHMLHGALMAAQNHVAIGVGLRGLRRVRNELFTRLQRLSMRFHQEAKAGDLIQRAAWDTYAFQTLFQQGIVTFATALLSLTLMACVMGQVNGPLTLVALGLAPLVVLSIKVFGKGMRERGAAAQQADSQVASSVQQTITALPLIQSYTREAHEEKKFLACTADAEAKRRSQHGAELLYGLGLAVVFGVGTAAIVGLGAAQVRQGELSVGELLVFLAYVAQLYEPLNQLSHVGSTVATASAGAQRVFEILDTPEEVKDAPEARAILSRKAGDRASASDSPSGAAAGPARRLSASSCPPHVIRGALCFDQVSFGYEAGQPVLREVSFRLDADKSAAVVGPNGAGKTTLLNLVLRFFDPERGGVRLDGVDLRELCLHDLREHIALVPQEPILLPATIAENIGYGKPEATMAEIETAARAAHAEDFIQRLPRKYQTRVGEGAARLSVGEKQRVSLARAFLKDAPILLLDEPTSALDTENEAFVTASLGALMRNRTTLIVAHRPATIRAVDRVLVLQAGRLVDDGTPAELLARPGYFAKMSAPPPG